ncbi:glycosyltransferase family 4 protein [Legionella oakridgensis]|uniref:Glycosyltransferase n=2 Tax=Legionella oakridgensis TaxID=29423 RepID=W0BFY6_9GAMM|nr:glycosyltransferase family 4 protein [Legionella oakridgensis]AHE67616.1 glycosyltransferase [Legionella oakridgensis ATCC 33761 = DSM 21215]ETO92854.1 glycosyltransferase [Legionella oakridgensis RV-2-2007]KTD37039.1 glycosyl transferase, group 1 [Legionella oakridgensis]STY20652.1 glycosyl transferase, group 1 [Legionella longbeachae]
MPEKIVHITTVHSARDPRIYYKECKSLADANFQVSLLAPGDENSCENNIDIIALGFPKNRIHRATLYQLKTLLKAIQQKSCIYHFHDPELIFTGLILKIMGKKVIYDVHEDVPQDILLKKHIPKMLRILLAQAARLSEKIAGYCFDAIITVTPTIAKKFPAKKVSLVRNFPRINAQDFSFSDYDKRDKELVYIGNMNEHRGLKEMVAAVSQLNMETKASLMLVGKMSADMEEKYIKFNKHIEYLSWLPFPEVSKVLNASKIGLVILHPTKTFISSYPLKFFEYMASGLPIIASNFPEWEAIIQKYDCGITVDPEDVESITKAIAYLLTNVEEAYKKGQNGRKAVLAEFSWEEEARVLTQVYQRLS